MDILDDFISTVDAMLDSRRKRHITGGILPECSIAVARQFKLTRRNTKMSKTGFAMFLAGATVGAAATWLCLRRYYEQITQEEIDSVKAAFAERKPVIANIAKNEKSNEKQGGESA